MKINNLFAAGVYSAPSIEIAEFSVEQGFAASLEWGEAGAAGNGGNYNEYDGGDL